jgi:hypothetical protein
MAIKYPISEDYATQSRQAFIRYQSRKVLLDEHETKLIDKVTRRFTRRNIPP